jgi:hypothetical protein
MSPKSECLTPYQKGIIWKRDRCDAAWEAFSGRAFINAEVQPATELFSGQFIKLLRYHSGNLYLTQQLIASEDTSVECVDSVVCEIEPEQLGQLDKVVRFQLGDPAKKT